MKADMSKSSVSNCRVFRKLLAISITVDEADFADATSRIGIQSFASNSFYCCRILKTVWRNICSNLNCVVFALSL